jgi:hypothetical protein
MMIGGNIWFYSLCLRNLLGRSLHERLKQIFRGIYTSVKGCVYTVSARDTLTTIFFLSFALKVTMRPLFKSKSKHSICKYGSFDVKEYGSRYKAEISK